MAEEENSFTVTTSDAPEVVEEKEEKKEEVKADEPKKEVQEPEGEDGKPEEKKEEDPANDEGEERKQRPRFQKRIDSLTKRAKDAERVNDELKERLDRLEGKDKEIDPTEYETYEEYQEALQSHKPQPKADPVQKAVQTALKDMEDSFDEARETHKDFDEVIKAEDLKVSADMLIALAEIDNSGDVAYHLGKNKKEAARISELSPTRQAIEIGKLSDKVKTPKEPVKKKTEAPDPITPNSGADDATRKNDADLSFREFEEKRNNQERKRGNFS